RGGGAAQPDAQKDADPEDQDGERKEEPVVAGQEVNLNFHAFRLLRRSPSPGGRLWMIGFWLLEFNPFLPKHLKDAAEQVAVVEPEDAVERVEPHDDVGFVTFLEPDGEEAAEL